MKLVIQGRLPNFNDYIAQLNSRYGRTGKIKREAKELVMLEIKKQKLKPAKEPVVIHYHWIEKDKRRDRSNISGFGIKVIEDALVSSGILKNDGWKNIIDMTNKWSVDKDNPRIEIEILEGN